MRGLDFPHLTPKFKRTILKAIDNCGGDKIFKLGIDGVIMKFHSRRKRRNVRFAREFALNGTIKSAMSTLFRIKEIGSTWEGNC